MSTQFCKTLTCLYPIEIRRTNNHYLIAFDYPSCKFSYDGIITPEELTAFVRTRICIQMNKSLNINASPIFRTIAMIPLPGVRTYSGESNLSDIRDAFVFLENLPTVPFQLNLNVLSNIRQNTLLLHYKSDRYDVIVDPEKRIMNLDNINSNRVASFSCVIIGHKGLAPQLNKYYVDLSVNPINLFAYLSDGRTALSKPYIEIGEITIVQTVKTTIPIWLAILLVKLGTHMPEANEELIKSILPPAIDGVITFTKDDEDSVLNVENEKTHAEFFDINTLNSQKTVNKVPSVERIDINNNNSKPTPLVMKSMLPDNDLLFRVLKPPIPEPKVTKNPEVKISVSNVEEKSSSSIPLASDTLLGTYARTIVTILNMEQPLFNSEIRKRMNLYLNESLSNSDVNKILYRNKNLFVEGSDGNWFLR